MTVDRFYQLLDNNKLLLSSEIYELKELVDQYPYFQQGLFLYLGALYKINDKLYKDELKRLGAFIQNRKALFYFIWQDEYKDYIAKGGNKTIATDKTDILLNAFFETLPNDSGILDYEYSASTQSGLISNDYLQYLSSLPDKKKDKTERDIPLKHQNIIDSFIEHTEKDGAIITIDAEKLKSPVNQSKEAGINEEIELNSDVFFTETLAKIYLKQKRYEKAYRIIKHLSLNYPEKNIYFADQLSFIEKLIINSKYKK